MSVSTNTLQIRKRPAESSDDEEYYPTTPDLSMYSPARTEDTETQEYFYVPPTKSPRTGGYKSEEDTFVSAPYRKRKFVLAIEESESEKEANSESENDDASDDQSDRTPTFEFKYPTNKKPKIESEKYEIWETNKVHPRLYYPSYGIITPTEIGSFIGMLESEKVELESGKAEPENEKVEPKDEKVERLPKRNFMEGFEDMDFNHFEIVADWMIEVQRYYKCPTRIAVNAIYYLARFLSINKDTTKDDLQSIALACVSLADKYVDRNHITLDELIYLLKCDKRDIVNMEWTVFKALDFRVAQVMPTDFMDAWMPALIQWNSDVTGSCLDKVFEMHFFMLLLSDEEIMSTKKSLLSAALLLVSLKKCGFACPDHPELDYCTHLENIVSIKNEDNELAFKMEEFKTLATKLEKSLFDYARLKILPILKEKENGDDDLIIPQILLAYEETFKRAYVREDKQGKLYVI